MINDLGNHLWQSTFFAAAVAVLSLVLRKNRARTRYWLWMAASLKFLIPFSLLVSLGSRLDSPGESSVLPALRVEQISTSFSPVVIPPMPAAATSWWPAALAALWILGALVLAFRWGRGWLELHRLRRRARPLPLAFHVPVLETPTAIEPGVFGLLRPVLLLPEGLEQTLAPEQMDAVLAHERCHIESRDNLTGALHVAVATIFWFHPVVWFIGRRLIEERERACDEAVLHLGKRPETYAQGILNICRFYKEVPLPCATGVTGADLKRRIREIMAMRASHRLTLARKAMLASAALTAVSVPIIIGVLRAQTLPPPPAYTYEVVSIKRNVSGETNERLGLGPQGGMRAQNLTFMALLTFAYDIRDYQFVGAPVWVNSERFDVSFTPDRQETGPYQGITRNDLEGWQNRNRQRMRAVLRDRFGLVLRAETREMPILALRVDAKGHKLQTAENPDAVHMSFAGQRITATAGTTKSLADVLAAKVGRFVVNETGLNGSYDYSLEWTETRVVPDESESATAAGGVSLYTALTEQVGLKLVPKRGPVPVFVVEKIEKPSEN